MMVAVRVAVLLALLWWFGLSMLSTHSVVAGIVALAVLSTWMAWQGTWSVVPFRGHAAGGCAVALVISVAFAWFVRSPAWVVAVGVAMGALVAHQRSRGPDAPTPSVRAWLGAQVLMGLVSGTCVGVVVSVGRLQTNDMVPAALLLRSLAGAVMTAGMLGTMAGARTFRLLNLDPKRMQAIDRPSPLLVGLCGAVVLVVAGMAALPAVPALSAQVFKVLTAAVTSAALCAYGVQRVAHAPHH
jgi:hypothetical protein